MRSGTCLEAATNIGAEAYSSSRRRLQRWESKLPSREIRAGTKRLLNRWAGNFEKEHNGRDQRNRTGQISSRQGRGMEAPDGSGHGDRADQGQGHAPVRNLLQRG